MQYPIHRFPSALLILIFLAIIGCKQNDDSRPCLPVAAVTSLRFRIFEGNTSKDLLLNNVLSFDSLKAQQPCYIDSLAKVYNNYMIPGTGDHGITFLFPNLRNPGVSEAGDCFLIYLQWNAQDADTIQWHYHTELDGGCKLQLLDWVQYNGLTAQKTDDGAYTYYALRKW